LKQLKAQSVEHLNQIDVMNVPQKVSVSQPAVMDCPECGYAMERFRYMIDSPVMLDCCNSCDGLWIDDGELTQMVEVLEGKLVQSTPNAPNSSMSGTTPRVKSEAEIQFELAHRATMSRYKAVTGVLGQVTKVLGTRWGH
jgi:Zn-finger nucleic acid-binding protein